MKNFYNRISFSRSDLFRLEDMNASQQFGMIDYAAVRRPATNFAEDFVLCSPCSKKEVAIAIGGCDHADERYASLLSCMRHFLRMQVSRGKADPATLAVEMNEILYECCSNDCFQSCFCANYSMATRRISYINAGHEAPLLVRAGSNEVIRLEQCGPVLGLQRSPRYIESWIQLQPGDWLVAFSTGIVDSFYESSYISAETALLQLIRAHRHCPANILAKLIISEAEGASPNLFVDRSVVAIGAPEGKQTVLDAAAGEQVLAVAG